MTGSRWQAVAALVDPVRRALYDYVRRQRRAVTREEAARAQAISRSLTAFHLDKLVDSGLLRARYEAPADQPRGRGRAPKVYEAAGDVAVTVPPRRYDLAGEVLADAVAATGGEAVEAVRREAYARGVAAGERCARGPAAAGSDGRAATRAATRAALADLGFEPCDGGPDGALLLANCPFHALAQRQRALVCGMNHAFVGGLLVGLGADGLTARLVPRPDACCVTVDAAG
jgi:predicted ArsR family transcriptional regulator